MAGEDKLRDCWLSLHREMSQTPGDETCHMQLRPLCFPCSQKFLFYDRLCPTSSRCFTHYAFRNIGAADANWHVIAVFIASTSPGFWWQLCREVVGLFVRGNRERFCWAKEDRRQRPASGIWSTKRSTITAE